jgi:hypothetical protein
VCGKSIGSGDRDKIDQKPGRMAPRETRQGARMKSTVSYKNYLIRAESFQREKNGKWIPQYNFTHQNVGSQASDFPSQQYQLNEVLPTEDAADDFALQKAMEWIDKN